MLTRPNVRGPIAVSCVFTAGIITLINAAQPNLFSTIHVFTRPVMLITQYTISWIAVIALLQSFTDSYYTGNAAETRLGMLLIPLHVFVTTYAGIQGFGLFADTDSQELFVYIELAACIMYIGLYYYVRPTAITEFRDELAEKRGDNL